MTVKAVKHTSIKHHTFCSIDPIKMKIIFDAPIGAKGVTTITSKETENRDAKARYIATIIETGGELKVQALRVYNSKIMFHVVLKQFDQAAIGTIMDGLREWSVSAGFPIIDEAKLQDDLTIFAASANKYAIIMLNHQHMEALQQNDALLTNRCDSRVMDENIAQADCVDLSHHFKGARNTNTVPEALRLTQFPGTTYAIPEPIRVAVFLVQQAINQNMPVNVLITGESGSGKTTFAEHLTNYLNLEYVFVPCSTWQNVNAVFFQRVVTEDSRIVVQKSLFAQALERGNCLILLDEITRADPDALNAILPILDNSKQTVINGDTRLFVHESVVIVATANIGAQFVGAQQLDVALLNRFGVKLVMIPPAVSEEVSIMQQHPYVGGLPEDIIKNVVKVLHACRQYLTSKQVSTVDVTVRTTEAILKNYVMGMFDGQYYVDLQTCFEMVLLNQFVDSYDLAIRKDLSDIIATNLMK